MFCAGFHVLANEANLPAAVARFWIVLLLTVLLYVFHFQFQFQFFSLCYVEFRLPRLATTVSQFLDRSQFFYKVFVSLERSVL